MRSFDPLQPLADAAMAWELQCVANAPASWWQQRRDQRLGAMLDHASLHSPVYAGAPRHDGSGLERLARWPVVQKHELMRQFDHWVTEPSLRLADLRAFVREPQHIGQLLDERFAVWESSGSSGEPGIFVHDIQALQVYDLLEAFRRPTHWLGLAPLAFVGATHGHFASVCTIERLRRQHPWLASSMRSFSFLQPMAALVEELQRFAPRVLTAYPSIALALAEEAEAGRLRLQLKSVWTGGETLTPAVRSAVQQAFGAPVVNSYGASEFLALAGSCNRGALHLNADWAVLEPVDAQYRPVPPGRFGHTTLLTNLANRVQPLIRYDLGDHVRIEALPCACGSPLPVIEVEGRTDDCLVLRDPQGRRVRLPPLALVSVLENEAEVFDFQLIQYAPDRLRLDLHASAAEGERQWSRAQPALQCYLTAQGLPGVRMSHRCAVDRAAGQSGKTRRIVSLKAD